MRTPIAFEVAEGAVIRASLPIKREDNAAIVGTERAVDKETGHKILVQLSKWESKTPRQESALNSFFAVQSLDRSNGTGMVR